MKRKLYHIIISVLFAIVAFSGTIGCCSVSAAKKNDSYTLNVTYSFGGAAFGKKRIKLYRVADITSNGEYKLCGRFKKYPVSMDNIKSNDEWEELSHTVNSYIISDAISADYTEMTDSGGKVVFSGLDFGVYFVAPVSAKQGNKKYSFKSFMAIIPLPSADKKQERNLTVKPKASVNTVARKKATYRVVKTWKDGSRKERPTSVKIEIFKNGKAYKTISLNSENGWMYSWTAADNGDEWIVAEKDVAPGYKVGIQQNGDVFSVTNAYFVNEDTPKTGNAANIRIYIIAAAISGSVFLILGAAQRKKRDES